MKQLNVLGICGSTRKGNSEYLLDQAIQSAHEAAPDVVSCTSYSVRGKKFGPCVACGKCGENSGECIIKDDFQQLRDLWIDADVIIYSVPVYHMGMPGQLKCFIDRLGNSTFGRYKGLYESGFEKLPKLLKVVGSIAQGVHICSGQEHTLTDLINHALLMQCIPVTGDMWQSYIGGGGWTSNDVDRNALKKQLEANQYDAQVAVQSAKDVGRRAVEIALMLRNGAAAMENELKKDASYKPFLDRVGDHS